jgi:HK97 family phage major capsid protein
MFKNRKEKTEKMNDLITRAETLVSTAESEKRELTDAEAAELAEIRDDIQRIKKYLDIVDDIDDARPGKEVGGEIKEAHDVIDGEDKRACGDDKARAIQEERAFENYLRNQVIHERAGELAPANNGSIIPVTIAKKIIELVYDICPILDRSEKYNVKGKLEIPYYPADASTQITVAFANEFTDLTSSTGNFTTIELSGYLAGALTKVSKSLVNNVDFDIVGFVVRRMAYDIARFLEKNLLGKGGGSVTGLGGATNVSTAASATAITADEVISLQGTVKDVFQDKAIWIMSPKTRDALRLLKDDVGRYLLNDDISAPFGKTLLGKPVYVSDNMDDIATGNKVIYYGDMSGLATKFSEELHVEVLRELYAAQHAIGVVGWVEFDAKVQDQQKIAVLKMA